MQFKYSPEAKTGKSEGSGGGMYLKLADKENITGVFRGEIEAYYAKWEGKTYVPCTENDPDGKFRFKINLIVKENGQYVAKVWEQGTIVYNMLKDLHEQFDLQKTIVSIKRNGTGTDTSYTILPNGRNFLVSPDMESKISEVELHDLSPKEVFQTNGVDESIGF